jgi:hypothetical protein
VNTTRLASRTAFRRPLVNLNPPVIIGLFGLQSVLSACLQSVSKNTHKEHGFVTNMCIVVRINQVASLADALRGPIIAVSHVLLQFGFGTAFDGAVKELGAESKKAGVETGQMLQFHRGTPVRCIGYECHVACAGYPGKLLESRLGRSFPWKEKVSKRVDPRAYEKDTYTCRAALSPTDR